MLNNNNLNLRRNTRPMETLSELLLEAQANRQNGYQGRNAREVLSDMAHIVNAAENPEQAQL